MEPRPCAFKEDGRTCGKYTAGPDSAYCPRHVLLADLDTKKAIEKAAKKEAEKRKKR